MFECFRQNICLIFCNYNCIDNIQDILLFKEPRRQVYLQRVCIFLPPPPLISQCTRLWNVPGVGCIKIVRTYRRFAICDDSASSHTQRLRAVHKPHRMRTKKSDSDSDSYAPHFPLFCSHKSFKP